MWFDYVSGMRKKLWIAYLCAWLVPGAFLFAFHIIVHPEYVKLTSSIFAGFANLFGPWATILLKLSDFPNAGGSFNLKYALLHTFILGAFAAVSMIAAKRWIRCCCGITVALLVWWWLFLGWAKIANCAI